MHQSVHIKYIWVSMHQNVHIKYKVYSMCYDTGHIWPLAKTFESDEYCYIFLISLLNFKIGTLTYQSQKMDCQMAVNIGQEFYPYFTLVFGKILLNYVLGLSQTNLKLE